MEIQAAGMGKTVVTPPDSAQKSFQGKFVKILHEIEKGENFINRNIRSAMRGKDFSTSELIALQAGVYRYTHRLEVFSKLVDRATSSVRQIMNPQ